METTKPEALSKELPIFPDGYELASLDDVLTNGHRWAYPRALLWAATKHAGERASNMPYNTYIRPKKETQR